VRSRRPGLGVFGGAAPPSAFDGYERASVIGAAANLPEAPRAKAEHRGRLPGWNFHIPLPKDSGIVASHLLSSGEPPPDDELRALAALMKLPVEARFTADQLTGLAEQLKIPVEVFLGVAKALAEVPPDARGAVLGRVETLLRERDRLKLEKRCVALFHDVVLPATPAGVEASLLLFDYSPGHVAFKTSLDRAALGQALHEIVEGWRSGKPRELVSDRPLNLPSGDEAGRILAAVSAAMPKEIGAALVFGAPPATVYASSGDREGMAVVLGELAENIALEDAVDVVAAARRVVQDWQCPSGPPKSASHFELFAMNVAHAWGVLGYRPGMTELETQAFEERSVLGAKHNTRFDELFRRALLVLASTPASLEQRFDGSLYEDVFGFLHAWRLAAFARLEVGHKLAASFCLTDVPTELEVRAPWPAWSLLIPDGLFPCQCARVWVHGTEPVFLVRKDGSFSIAREDEDSPAHRDAIRSLIRACCLALTDREQFRKENRHRPTARAKSQRQGPPDFEQDRYLLSTPVTVDVRPHLLEVLSGAKRGGHPTVQFLVRGHPKMQAHGPRHSLRKPIWVEPFWKGPEGARVLLRTHKVKEDE
jgi:hypothetical protein